MEIELRKKEPMSGFPHTNATRECVERRGRVVGMSAGEEIRSCGNWARVVVVPRRGVGFLLVLVLEETCACSIVSYSVTSRLCNDTTGGSQQV